MACFEQFDINEVHMNDCFGILNNISRRHFFSKKGRYCSRLSCIIFALASAVRFKKSTISLLHFGFGSQWVSSPCSFMQDRRRMFSSGIAGRSKDKKHLTRSLHKLPFHRSKNSYHLDAWGLGLHASSMGS